MDKDEFLAVFEHLLGDRLEAETFQRLMEDAFRLIAYSVGRFKEELIAHAGYTPLYALRVARQIVPKPVLYSSVIYSMVHEGTLTPVFEGTQEGENRRRAFMALQYDLLAPSFTAFLYDQTIDDFNIGYQDGNLIEAEVMRAAEVLADQPDFYRRTVFDVLDLCQTEHITADDLPPDLKPYWLLVAYVNRLLDAGLPAGEIRDILHTVSDVLAHEHMAELAHSAVVSDEAAFSRPQDFVDAVQGTVHEMGDRRAEAVARAILRGQGFLMVSVSQYTLYKLRPAFDEKSGHYRLVWDEGAPDASAREVLQACPYLCQSIRLYELVVRAGDDAGDLELDRERGAPNAILDGRAGRDAMLILSGLKSADISPQTRDSFAALLEREVSDHAAQAELAAQLIDGLLELEGAITQRMNRTWMADGSIPYKNEARKLIDIMRWVVFGSIVNARFNDDFAERLGTALGKTA